MSQNLIPEAVHQCARPSPHYDMKAKINALLAYYPAIDVAAMGFPRGWENEPLWQ